MKYNRCKTASIADKHNPSNAGYTNKSHQEPHRSEYEESSRNAQLFEATCERRYNSCNKKYRTTRTIIMNLNNRNY